MRTGNNLLFYFLLLFVFSACTDSSNDSPNNSSDTDNIVAQNASVYITSSSNYLQEGDTVTLTANISAEFYDAIEWTYSDGNDSATLQSSLSTTLTLSNFQSVEEGYYEVVIYNEGEIIADASIYLATDDEDPVTNDEDDDLEPTDFLTVTYSVNGTSTSNISEGDEIVFTVDTNISGIDSYTWSFDDGNSVQELISTTAMTYTISDLSVDESGTYIVDAYKDGNLIETRLSAINVDEEEEPEGTFMFLTAESETSSTSFIKAGQSFSLTINHDFAEYDFITWYFDNGSGPVELTTNFSEQLNFEDTDSSSEGTYSAEFILDGEVIASDTLFITIEEDDEEGSLAYLVSKVGATSTSLIEVGQNITFYLTHNYPNVDYYIWYGPGGIQLNVTEEPEFTLNNAELEDSGTYSVSLIENNEEVAFATLLITVEETETSNFTSCGDNAEFCPEPIKISTGGACAEDQFATSCNGIEEQGCIRESDESFSCNDGGDGDGCQLFCHDRTTSPLKNVLDLTDFKTIEFDEDDGTTGCGADYLATGCSGNEDQTCEPAGNNQFQCLDEGSGDDPGCQLFCWKKQSDASAVASEIEFDTGETASCGTGAIPTGCSGNDEDYCEATSAGEYQCVDGGFFGFGCTLYCLEVQ